MEVGLPHRHGFRIVPADGVPHDHQVGRWVEIALRETIHQEDALLFELGRHWRIDAGIRSANSEACLLQESGEGPHSRATDGHKVDGLGVARNSAGHRYSLWVRWGPRW